MPSLSKVGSEMLDGALPALDASSLTSIPASNITGTLPAISGTNLTNLDARDLENALPAISGASLTGISSGIRQVVSSATTTWGATSSTSYADIAGCSASITTSQAGDVLVRCWSGGTMGWAGVRGFIAIQNYTASSSTQFQETMVSVGHSDSNQGYSVGMVQYKFTGLAAGTWNFRGRWAMHAANGSFNNSRCLGGMCLWELG